MHNKKNAIQEKFNKLVRRFGLKYIYIKGECYYGLNNIPLTKQTINNKLNELRLGITNEDGEEIGTSFYMKNVVKINNKYLRENECKRNFETIIGSGTNFGTFKMVNYIIMNSDLCRAYKIEIIDILDEIRKYDFYIDKNISDENYERLLKRFEEIEKRFYIITGNWSKFADALEKHSIDKAFAWEFVRKEYLKKVVIDGNEKWVVKENAKSLQRIRIKNTIDKTTKEVKEVYFVSEKCIDSIIKSKRRAEKELINAMENNINEKPF